MYSLWLKRQAAGMFGYCKSEFLILPKYKGLLSRPDCNNSNSIVLLMAEISDLKSDFVQVRMDRGHIKISIACLDDDLIMTLCVYNVGMIVNTMHTGIDYQ